MKKALLVSGLFFSISSFSQQSPDLKLDLFFDVNRSVLTKQHLMLIDSVFISKNLVVTTIKGFADSTGNSSYNMDLSQKRALGVFRYFTSPHNDFPSISVEYFGEQNAGSSDMFYDRRVEIWFRQKLAEKVTVVEDKIRADTLAITEKYEISNIYFIPDKAIVDPSSFFAVDDAAKYLEGFPGCKFEIVGHVNNVMTPSETNIKALEPVQKLSEERAKTIYDLMIERGIPAESMTFKGVGNSQMVFKNPQNEAEQRKNMRVEIIISCKK